MEQTATASTTAKRALVITRTFDATRDKVWKAWTDQAFSKWWGPKEFTGSAIRMDVRVGGKYLNAMRSPDGKDIFGTGEYREVKAPERLVFTDHFADKDGKEVPASDYGMSGDWSEEVIVTVTLEDLGDQTRMTMKHEGLPTEILAECETGWNESFDKLAASLK